LQLFDLNDDVLELIVWRAARGGGCERTAALLSVCQRFRGVLRGASARLPTRATLRSDATGAPVLLADCAAVRTLRMHRGYRGACLTLPEHPALLGATSLAFDGAVAGEAELRKLPALRSLAALSLGIVHSLAASSAQLLGALPALTALTLAYSNVHDVGAATQLRRLQVHGAELNSLERLTLLTHLSFNGPSVDATALTALTELRELDARSDDSSINDAHIAAVGRLRQLSTLRLGGGIASHASVRQLSSLTCLTALSLLSLHNRAGCDALPRSLMALEISSSFDDAGLASVAALTQLTVLRLPMCNEVSDEGLSRLTQLRALARLQLHWWQGRITATGIDALAQLPALTTLTLAGGAAPPPGPQLGQRLRHGDLTLSSAWGAWLM